MLKWTLKLPEAMYLEVENKSRNEMPLKGYENNKAKDYLKIPGLYEIFLI